MSSDEESGRSLVIPKDSDRGSSVSSDFQDEYDELLRYAVVTPKFGPHFLREHQLTAEQTTSDRISSPREAVQELIPERQLSSLEDIPRSLDRETPRSSPTNVPEHNLPKKNPSETLFPRTFASGMEAFSPVHSDELLFHSSSSSASARSQTERMQVAQLPVPSENMLQVEELLDLWSGNLKTHVLAELSKWRLTIIEKHRLEMKEQNKKHTEHITHLSNQIDSLQALIQTYETSIQRKDEVISNLTRALEKQKEKTELMRTFSHWRLQQMEARQEDYVCNMADKHYKRMLLKHMWRTWRSVIESSWKDKVEQACRARAEEVCIELSSDYESKIAQLCGALEEARAEVSRLHTERGQFEGSMKKAFMRGVCALNMEAMSMFQGRDIRTEHVADHPPRREDPGCSPSVTFQQVPTTSVPRNPSQHDLPSSAVTAEQNFRPPLVPSSVSESKDDMSTPVVISATTSGSSVLSTQKLPVTRVITSGQQKAGKTITARITARSDLAQKFPKPGGSVGSMGVSPPMSSVVVEKHHPITQQTISQAIAAKYPRTALQSSSSISGRVTGQSARTSQVHSGVHSIKVVD
ncbi:centrosomal protein POC5 isoform X2 [Hyla sarda]|uniref:centrosomal protein POC5 isoform X2 n=1 Tax=Hyla sarda TaxID=327740 RepID=UPI0024C420AC|nr:centrosomal protein POC5 isoform X2 [Hyla sarda]XP_056396292.1 centrosomal protein POC5 isoform X2 [Hyla sarda]